MADKLIRLGLGLVVTVWIARYLGPARFGLLNFAIAFVALFSIFSNLGLQGVLVRDLVTHPERRESLLGSALLLRLVGSVLAVVIAAITIVMMRPSDGQSLRIVTVVALMLVPQAWDVIDFDYQVRLNARPIVVIRNLSFLISSAVKGLLILNRASLISFAWITMGEVMLSAAIMSAYARSHGKLPTLRSATTSEIRYLLRTAWPLIVSGVSVILYWRIDQVMLGEMIGDRGVGLFSAAVRISEVWYFIPVSLVSSVAPILTSVFERSRTEYLQKLTDLTRLITAIGMATSIALTVFAHPIVAALYGPQYLKSSVILAIHSWAGIFVALGVVSSSWFINSGLFRYSMYQTFTGAVVNIALNSVLIPKYAGVGAAMATVLSQAIAAVLLNALTARTRELFRIQMLSFIPSPLIKRL